MNGTCKLGNKCKLLHDPCRKNKELCKAFTRGYCSKVRDRKRDNGYRCANNDIGRKNC